VEKKVYSHLMRSASYEEKIRWDCNLRPVANKFLRAAPFVSRRLRITPRNVVTMVQQNLGMTSIGARHSSFFGQPRCRLICLQNPKGRFQYNAKQLQRRAATLSSLPRSRLERQGLP
jgi:hypothetical protein